ncbi:MAG: hypothetical protein GX851_01875 [Clostridiales bacterium]|nr:hypothetical protein [Clostridiales bacterium]
MVQYSYNTNNGQLNGVTDGEGNATVSATGNTFAHIITYALLAALNPIRRREPNPIRF